MNLQDWIDGASARMQRERGESQMTLGTMIEILNGMPKTSMVTGFGNPHSYRGYYCDLAFEPTENRIAAESALELCKSALGEVYTGWKGGEYMMGKNTPIWMAHVGCCGDKIMDLISDGTIITEKD